jgi:hypothetical protein
MIHVAKVGWRRVVEVECVVVPFGDWPVVGLRLDHRIAARNA